MLQNHVREKLAQGRTVFGAFIGTKDARLVEICGHAGFDYVLLDAEHYPFTESDIEELVRAAQVVGIPAFVRIPVNRPEVIRHTLDVGAWGIMVPQVRDLEEVTAAVSAAKYAPLGARGAVVPRIAGSGATLGFREWSRISNEQTMIIIQLETREIIDHLPQLLRIPGVDAFELGRSDLSQSLGHPGEPNHPSVQAYHDRAVQTVLDAGRVLGDTTDDPVEAASFVSRGYRMVACNLNRLVLIAGRAYVAEARRALPTAADQSGPGSQ